MARDVDEKKTRKALRKLKRAAERATEAGGPGLTDWEKQFVEGVSTRLETYGSAFRDPGKGSLDEALSERQTHIVRAIDKKGRKAKAASGPPAEGEAPQPQPRPQRPHSSFKRKGPPLRSTGRDIRADEPPALEIVPAAPAPPAAPPAAKPGRSAVKPAAKRSALRVIRGGRDA